MWAATATGTATAENKRVDGAVAVAIDRDRGSQQALKWALDHLLAKGQLVSLIHVVAPPTQSRTPAAGDNFDSRKKDMFLPFRCFCRRKDVECKDITLEDSDVAKALIDYVSLYAIEHLVMGTSSKAGLLRFKTVDIPNTVSKGAPDFCTVYAISKGKISSMRSASRPAPFMSPLSSKILSRSHSRPTTSGSTIPYSSYLRDAAGRSPAEPPESLRIDELRVWPPPINRRKASDCGFSVEQDSSIFPIRSNSCRLTFERISPTSFENKENDPTPCPWLSDPTELEIDKSFDSIPKSIDASSSHCHSVSQDNVDDVESEMKKLKLELKQTMEMYSVACREALIAKQAADELERWKLEEERRLVQQQKAGEAAMFLAQKEMAKSKAAIEAAEASQRIADLEAQKRRNAEMKVIKEASAYKEEMLHSLGQSDIRYRKYTIEEIEAATDFFSRNHKIGEGGYGPVYKGLLDHTPVAIKILRPDAAGGRSQFQQEVEVLSCIRHPNMVLLLGACPEYGCLIYEFMGRGSLEDCLFRRGGAPPLSWKLRFKIAAEIGAGLLFLHQNKPEPIVHRDLKPANILLDKNYTSKISDVGLARLLPPNVSDSVTQYRLTSTAGTFCYIDPEYQQTGMLGVKSDIYSLGIMFLQLITAKPAMGLTHQVENAIENGRFPQVLDPAVPDWPVAEALRFSKLALKCSELRRKDWPDLGKVVMPELVRLRALSEESMHLTTWSCSTRNSSPASQVSLCLEMMSPPTSSMNISI